MEFSRDGPLDPGRDDAGGELEAFAHGIAHDLRSPLRAISGFAGLLAEDYAADLPLPGRRYLELIQQSAGEMNQMLDGLLAISHAGRMPLARQVVDPARVARAALAGLEEATRGRSIEMSIGDLPDCSADPDALEQVFSTLLSNALEVTRGRDPARIEIGYGAARGPPGPDAPGAYFVRPVGRFEKGGVQFTIAQRSVRRHGGEMWTNSGEDPGTTVNFTIGVGA